MEWETSLMKQNELRILVISTNEGRIKLDGGAECQTTVIIQTASTFMKLVLSAKCAKETAEFVTHAPKCVVGMSTIFRLVVILARFLSIYEEANQCYRVLPVALSLILILLRYVL